MTTIMTTEENQIYKVAKNLAKALRKTTYYDCNYLNHSGGNTHADDEECPVIKMCEEALKDFEELKKC